jgi:uncharacterized protein involved in exopolysaccharide biosynthesis
MKQQERALVLRDAATPKMTPRGLVAVLFRRKRTILLSFAALMIGTVLMIMVLPAQYQSDMTVLIERERFDPVVTSSQSRNSADNAVPQLARLSEQDVNSEVGLLQSTDLLRKVVLECKLYDRLQWWRVLLLGANTREKKIDMATNGLQNNLIVNPPNKSNLITITYSSRDPRNSADVLNTLGKLYLQKHVEVHRPQAQYTFFQSEVDQYRKQLREAQLRVVTFNQQHGLASANTEQTNLLQKMADLDADLRTTQAGIRDTEQRVSELEVLTKSTAPRHTTQVRTLGLLLEQLKSNLDNLQLKRAELLTKYEPTYRAVQDVDQQIAEVRSYISRAEGTPTVEQTTDAAPAYDLVMSEMVKAKSDLAGLRAREAAMVESLKQYKRRALDLGKDGIEQQNLLREAKLTEDNYSSALRKQEESRMSEALDRERIVNVSIAEQASPAALPMIPIVLELVLGIFACAALSSAIGFAVDYFDTSLRTPQELQDYLGLPVLAALPEEREMKLLPRVV